MCDLHLMFAFVMIDVTLADDDEAVEDKGEDILSQILSGMTAAPRPSSSKAKSKSQVSKSKDSKVKDKRVESQSVLGARFLEFLQQNTEVSHAMLAKLSGLGENEPAKSQRPQKRQREEVDEEACDLSQPDLWTLSGNYEVNDNSVDKLEWSLRLKLRNPNSLPSTWWKPELMDTRVTYPRRSHSLVADHLSGTQKMNPDTIAR